MAEQKEVELDDEVVDIISKRVRASVDKDLKEWSDEIYKEVKDDVRDHLSALRDHQDAYNIRMMQFSKKLDDISARLEARVAKEELIAEEEPSKVEAKSEAEEAEEEDLKDVLVVCDHGGKGERLGFTEKDQKEGVRHCPVCGARIRYP